MNVYTKKMVTCACPLCAGVFIARGKEDALVTQSIVPGETVYGEKKVSVEVSFSLSVCLSVCLSIAIVLSVCSSPCVTSGCSNQRVQ